jgi:hypothetical protein
MILDMAAARGSTQIHTMDPIPYANSSSERASDVPQSADLRLEASNAELQKIVFHSSAQTIISLRRALDLNIEDYNLLRDGNNSLLAERNTLYDRVADLESELAEVSVSAARGISALEAKVVCTEARPWTMLPPWRSALLTSE